LTDRPDRHVYLEIILISNMTKLWGSESVSLDANQIGEFGPTFTAQAWS